MCFAVISMSSYDAPTFYVRLSLTANAMSFHYIFIASGPSPFSTSLFFLRWSLGCTRSALDTDRRQRDRSGCEWKEMSAWRKTEEVLSMFSEIEAKRQVRRQQLWRRASRSLGGNCDTLFTVIHYVLSFESHWHVSQLYSQIGTDKLSAVAQNTWLVCQIKIVTKLQLYCPPQIQTLQHHTCLMPQLSYMFNGRAQLLFFHMCHAGFEV